MATTPLYLEDHLSCYLYNNEDAIVQYLNKEKGTNLKLKTKHNCLLFLVKGEIKCSFQYQIEMTLKAGDFLLIPRENNCVIDTHEDHSEIVILKMHHKVNFCNHFPLEVLFEMDCKTKKTPRALQANEIINDWLETVKKTILGGLKCSYYQELKQKEVLYYLRAYYTKEDLLAFFAPILNGDMQFSNLIYDNYTKVKKIDELAALTNYSLSGFKRKFGRVFDCSPAVWIEREKAKKIYHEINSTLKPFKEIASEYKFSSSSHFDRFCKKMYKMSPGKLRKNTKKNVLLNDDKNK